jgi:hypothetical protein
MVRGVSEGAGSSINSTSGGSGRERDVRRKLIVVPVITTRGNHSDSRRVAQQERRAG